jgi:hypothetical protein
MNSFLFIYFACYFLLIKLCFIKQWLNLINMVKQTMLLTNNYMQNKRRWSNTNF